MTTVRSSNPLTVKFYFKRSSPGFLQGTATIGSGLVSLSTLNRQYDELGDARHIIGSGPFVVSGETLGARSISAYVKTITGDRPSWLSKGGPIWMPSR